MLFRDNANLYCTRCRLNDANLQFSIILRIKFAASYGSCFSSHNIVLRSKIQDRKELRSFQLHALLQRSKRLAKPKIIPVAEFCIREMKRYKSKIILSSIRNISIFSFFLSSLFYNNLQRLPNPLNSKPIRIVRKFLASFEKRRNVSRFSDRLIRLLSSLDLEQSPISAGRENFTP